MNRRAFFATVAAAVLAKPKPATFEPLYSANEQYARTSVFRVSYRKHAWEVVDLDGTLICRRTSIVHFLHGANP